MARHAALLLLSLVANSVGYSAIEESTCVVPPLACFGESPISTSTLPGVAEDLSGITYNSDSDTIFAVTNGEAHVYEIYLWTGTLLHEWSLPASIEDPEAIEWLGGDLFAITDENPASIYTVTLTRTLGATVEQGTIVDTVSVGIDPPAGDNTGFEGVAWIPGTGFLAAQELLPATVWQVADTGSTPINLYGDLPFISLGDMTGSCSSSEEFFLLVKHPSAVHRIDLATGESIEQYAGDVCDMTQPEGLTFAHRNDGSLFMIVVGEPNEVLVFEAMANCTLDYNSTSGTQRACPVTDTGVKGCEKTMEDGGCPYTRCDKSITPYIKACTDDTPGVTDCDLSECYQKCVDETSMDCAFYAFDEAEGECYLFEDCQEALFSADYHQYAMVDDTCEKTLQDYPLGCEARRCDKDTNNNEKVCDKDEVTCTVEECEAHCVSYTAFTCTTYAYDAEDGDCYVFESCEDEDDKNGYNTYVLVDPTCEKNLDEGGCQGRVCSTSETGLASSTPTVGECAELCALSEDLFCTHYSYDASLSACVLFASCEEESDSEESNLYVMGYEEKLTYSKLCDKSFAEGGCDLLRCDKDITPYEKICEDDEPGVTDCTVEECRQKCMDDTTLDCTHFAYDVKDAECYIFEGCEGEKFDEDYTLYVLEAPDPCLNVNCGFYAGLQCYPDADSTTGYDCREATVTASPTTPTTSSPTSSPTMSPPPTTSVAIGLVFTELMFNALDPTEEELAANDDFLTWEGDDFDFLELLNESGDVLDLSGFYFEDGINLEFPEGTLLGADMYLLLVANIEAMELRYGSLPETTLEYSKSLSNGGEDVVIKDSTGVTVFTLLYDDGWEGLGPADGDGYSLVLTSVGGGTTEEGDFEISQTFMGSPGRVDGPTSSPTPSPTACVNDENYTSEHGDCSSYKYGMQNHAYCFMDGVVQTCCAACSETSITSTSTSTSTFPPTPAPTTTDCEDDPDFNIGFGDCSTYAFGELNYAYCATDGAVDVCCVACSSTEDECTDDPDFDIGFGDCSTYFFGELNYQYCAGDGAVDVCCVACSSDGEDECSDDPDFNFGFGDCSTYFFGELNYQYCAGDGAVDECCVACSSEEGTEECTEDDPDFDIGFGDCSTYVYGELNHVYCATDEAVDVCCAACASTEECSDDPDFDAGYGDCSTYEEGESNHVFCQADGADDFCCACN